MSIGIFLWEIIMTFIETGMICYFLIVRLGYTSRKRHYIALGLIILAVVSCLVGYFEMPGIPKAIVMFIMDVLFTLLVFNGSIGKKILTACIAYIIPYIASVISFGVVSVANVGNTQLVMETSDFRLITQILYLAVEAALFLFAGRIKNKSIELSPYMLAANLVMISSFAISIVIILVLSLDPAISTSTLRGYLTICIILLSLTFLSLWVFDRLGISVKKNMDYEKERQQARLEADFNRRTEETMRVMETWRHDYKNQLISLSGYLKAGDLPGSLDYLDQLTSEVQETKLMHTGNKAVDAIVSNKMLIAQSENIPLDVSIEPVLDQLPIEETEFTSILGNLLDNAIESCRKIDDPGKRFIDFFIHRKNDMLLIELKNSSLGEYQKQKGGALFSTKGSSRRGLGIERIQKIVTSHDGYIAIYPEDTTFLVQIMFGHKLQE